MNLKPLNLCLFLYAFSNPLSADTFDWSGAYIGANIGVIWSNAQMNSAHNNFVSTTTTYHQSLSTEDVNPGLQFGYLHQFENNWVLGLEADYSYPSLKKEFTEANQTTGDFDKFKTRYDMQGSLRLRLGYAIDRFLPYITSGVSFGGMSFGYTNEANQDYRKDTAQTGWVLGAGVEYGVLDNVSTRLEYLYTDYSNALRLNMPNVDGVIDPSGSTDIDMANHVLRMAINYRF